MSVVTLLYHWNDLKLFDKGSEKFYLVGIGLL